MKNIGLDKKMIDKLWYLVNNNLVEAIELKQGKTKYKRDLNKTFKYSEYNREKKRFQKKEERGKIQTCGAQLAQ